MEIHRSHNGLFLGVCDGLAESLGIPAKYFRLLFIITALLFRTWFVLAFYLLAALLMPVENNEEWKIQENFESLSRDAKLKAQEEYQELMETIRKNRKGEKTRGTE
ncbi:PspC domain-containing protein [Oceanispirochaeta sp.]|jgi:phage shock protein C|uniref:PspC domain-containing protein n=1 Tax=Oceanispirochaeta sp. TaxID=2035350 RepID=UPI00260F3264|nr:PspC domain-containing protein [Oceanispirochaeta sp.]MDA3958140.1 PspC domain-containing protein [Oceanispirochaeta sp.]